MPAAAVTPAPVAYINIAALKKLVVRRSRGFLLAAAPDLHRSQDLCGSGLRPQCNPLWPWLSFIRQLCSCEQIRVLQAGFAKPSE